MSYATTPVGDVEITCAMQDAIVAANILAGPLKADQVRIRDLAHVQRRREWSALQVAILTSCQHHPGPRPHPLSVPSTPSTTACWSRGRVEV